MSRCQAQMFAPANGNRPTHLQPLQQYHLFWIGKISEKKINLINPWGPPLLHDAI